MTVGIIGGGTGTSFLAKVMPDAQYIVSVFDSGGSTGILRQGTPAVGDLRKVLSNLGANLEYRPGMHPVGNLLLQSRMDQGESIQQAVDHVRRMCGISTRVYPITLADRQLVATYGMVSIVGEHRIDTSGGVHGNPVSLQLNAPAKMHAIPQVDTLILAPGDVWTSLIPNFLVDGFTDWVRDTNIVLCVNTLQKPGETKDWDLRTYVSTIEQYLGRSVDVLIADTMTEFQGNDHRLHRYVLSRDGVPDAALYKEALCKHI